MNDLGRELTSEAQRNILGECLLCKHEPANQEAFRAKNDIDPTDEAQPQGRTTSFVVQLSAMVSAVPRSHAETHKHSKVH